MYVLYIHGLPALYKNLVTYLCKYPSTLVRWWEEKGAHTHTGN